MTVTGDPLVYAHPDGATYVATLDDGERWWRWAAERNGWQERVRCSEALADDCEELPSRLARLALRLSGVPADA